MIVDKLNDIINSYGKDTSIKILCFYIKDNIYNIERLNVNDIARGCYMSKGQISKCIKQLGYNSFLEFKNDCISYKESLTRKQSIFIKEKDLMTNINDTTNQYIKCLKYTLSKFDYNNLNQLSKDIIKSRYVYLYGQGDVRGNCYNIQRELKYLDISVIILDEKLSDDYIFDKHDLLLVLSTNGQLFEYNDRQVRKLKQMDIKKWLITCNERLEFCDNQLCFYSLDDNYNEMIMTYMINLIILNMKVL